MVQSGEIGPWQRQDKAAMLDRGEDHGYGAEQNERYSDGVRKMRRRSDRSSRWHALSSKKAQKKTEAGYHESKAHDGETGANPRQEGSFGCEEDARVGHVGHVASVISVLRLRPGLAARLEESLQPLADERRLYPSLGSFELDLANVA